MEESAEKKPQRRFILNNVDKNGLKQLIANKKIVTKKIRKCKDKNKIKYLISLKNTHRLKDLKKKCENVDIKVAVNSEKFNLEFNSDSFESSSTSLQSEVHELEQDILQLKQAHEKEILDLKQFYEKQLMQNNIQFQLQLKQYQEKIDQLQNEKVQKNEVIKPTPIRIEKSIENHCKNQKLGRKKRDKNFKLFEECQARLFQKFSNYNTK